MTKDELHQLSEWLPEDTQSIIVSRGNFRLPPPLNVMDMSDQFINNYPNEEQWWKHPIMSVEDHFHHYCTVAPSFYEIGQRRLYETIQKKNVLLSVKIFRRFEPDQFDIQNKTKWQERACNIAFFDTDQSNHNELVTLLKNYCSRKFELAGHTVFECDKDNIKSRKKSLGSFQKFLDAEKNYYLAQGDIAKANKVDFQRPRRYNFRSVLICVPKMGILLSTFGDIETLAKVLDTKKDQKTVNKFLSIPEWSLINDKSTVFGIRHFPLAGKVDPSSPLNLSSDRSASSTVVDPKAVGFVLNLYQGEIEYIYRSNTENLKAIYPLLFPVNDSTGDLQKDGRVIFEHQKIKISVNVKTKSGVQSPRQARYWLGQLK